MTPGSPLPVSICKTKLMSGYQNRFFKKRRSFIGIRIVLEGQLPERGQPRAPRRRGHPTGSSGCLGFTTVTEGGQSGQRRLESSFLSCPGTGTGASAVCPAPRPSRRLPRLDCRTPSSFWASKSFLKNSIKLNLITQSTKNNPEESLKCFSAKMILATQNRFSKNETGVWLPESFFKKRHWFIGIRISVEGQVPDRGQFPWHRARPAGSNGCLGLTTVLPR